MKKKTFSLLELTIVLLIIGALMTLSIAQYNDSQKLSKMQVFESNVNDIQKALSIYKSNQVLLGSQTEKYPMSLSDPKFKSLFKQEPINPYTNKSMLSDNSSESGIQYVSTGSSYSICIAQQDVDDINNNGRTDDPLPVTSYPACTGTIQPPPSSEYVVTVVTFPSGGGTAYAVPNQAASGATITLVQNPASCYNFSGWLSSGVTILNPQSPTTSFVMPAKDVAVTANYAIKTYTISAAPNNPSYGTVTGSGTYSCGSTATLTAVPNAGYTFVGWYENGSRVSTTATYAFTVSGNRTLEVRFNAIPYTITVNKNPTAGGSPTAAPNPAYVGQTVTLTANPSTCYDFTDWISTDVTITNNSFVMSAKDVTVTANYTIRQYTVSAAPNNPSYGTVTGSGTYDCSSTATLTAVPNTGYTFVGWYENSNQVSTATTYIFTVSGNRTLEARFAVNITIAFARNSVAYTSNGIQVATGVPRYETGKFGKAVMVEEGTTNRPTANQSSVETDLTGLNVWISAGTASIARDTTVSWHGVASAKATNTGTGVADLVIFIPSNYAPSVTVGSTYTFSVYGRISQPGTIRVDIDWYTSTNTFISRVSTNYSNVPANQFVYCTVTGTAPTNAAKATLNLVWTSAPAGGNLWWDGAQFEQKPYATSWTLGGTTRAQETLSIFPVSSILTPQQGTIETWVYVPDFWKSGIPYYRRIWSIGTDVAVGLYWFGYNPAANKMEFSIYKDATIANTIYVDKPAVGWHLFTVRWSASEMSLWIDGVKMGSKTSPSLPTNFADTILTIGCRPDTPYDNVNTLIDDFRVSNRARADAEIQTLYQSNQPAPKDADTTLKLTFDGNLDA